MTNTPELALSEEEGVYITDSAQAVLRHYSVETTQKTLDTFAFASALGMVYLPRIAAISARKKAEAGPRGRRGRVGNVVQLRPGQPTAVAEEAEHLGDFPFGETLPEGFSEDGGPGEVVN